MASIASSASVAVAQLLRCCFAACLRFRSSVVYVSCDFVRMTLDDLLQDIYALEDEVRGYERKYGVLSETFYEAYAAGDEPSEDTWVRDWAAWASAYELLQQRQGQYRTGVKALRAQGHTTAAMIEKAARHESIPIPA